MHQHIVSVSSSLSMSMSMPTMPQPHPSPTSSPTSPTSTSAATLTANVMNTMDNNARVVGYPARPTGISLHHHYHRLPVPPASAAAAVPVPVVDVAMLPSLPPSLPPLPPLPLLSLAPSSSSSSMHLVGHSHVESSSTPAPSPLPVIPSTSSSPLIPHSASASAPGTRARSNSSSSSNTTSSSSAASRPSLLQRRASRSLSLSLPTSPLLMDPTDAPMLVSPSLYPPSLVANNLYLGSQHSLHYLRAGLPSSSSPPQSIAVLNVAEELPPLSPRTATANRATHYLHIPMSHAPNLADHLPAALAFIDTHLLAGRPVLVHCMCGVSRSAAVVLAYLMWKAKWGFRTAYEHVKARRNISPNMHLVCQLVEFAMELELPGDHSTPQQQPSSGAAPAAAPLAAVAAVTVNGERPAPSSVSSSPDRNHQPTDSTAAMLAANTSPSVAIAAEHQLQPDTDGMDVDHMPPPPPPHMMDHVAQVMLVATTAAHVRAASHPESNASSPPDTPCSYMTAFTSLPTPLLGQDGFPVAPATPLTADCSSADSPMAFASPARPIRRLSAATISITSLAATAAPPTAPASPASTPAHLAPPRIAVPLSSRNPSMSSISSITSSISTHTSLVSPQSAMLDAFPLTDPDLMAATRAGPQSANAKAAAQAAVAAATAVGTASPLGTPRTPAGMGPLTPLTGGAAAAAGGSRPRSRSNPNIPASYPSTLAAMHEADEGVPAVPVLPPAFQLPRPPGVPVHAPNPVPAAAGPTVVLGKPPLGGKFKRGTPPPRINTSNLGTATPAAAASTAGAPVSAPVVSHPPRLPLPGVAGMGDQDVPPVPPLPPASAYPHTAAAGTAMAPPPPLPPFLAIPPELDVRPLFPLSAAPTSLSATPGAAPLARQLEPPTPTTFSFAAVPVPAAGLSAKRPPMLNGAPLAGPNGTRKVGPGPSGGMRLQAARSNSVHSGGGGLPPLPPTPLGAAVGGTVGDECPTPSGLGFKGFFREDDAEEQEEREQEGGYPWPVGAGGAGDEDAMDVCK